MTLGPLYGPVMMALAMFMFAVNDALLKWLSNMQGVPLYQTLLIRSGWITMLMLAICLWRLGPRGLLGELRKPAYALFGLAEVAVAVPYIYALKLLPLQTAQPIIKINPLVAVLIAVLVFGQPSNWVRWTAIACGVAGVLAIVDPWSGFQADILILLPMVSALILGSRDVLTNTFGTRMDPFATALSMGFFMTLMSAIFQGMALDGPWVPLTHTGTILPILALFIVTPLAYVTRVIGIQNGDMSAIAPMVYSGMAWAILFGVVVFRDPLGWNQIFGAILIAGGGLMLIWFDRRPSGSL